MITQPLKIAPCHGQNVVKSQPVTWHRSPESVWRRVPLMARISDREEEGFLNLLLAN